jgi:toxin FitB
MAEYLVDTDVLIDHLRGHARLSVSPERSAISTLTRAELYAGQRADERAIDLLLGTFAEIAVDRVIAEEAGRIRRTTGIGLADAAIAATAIASGRTLVTRNRRHFDGIPGLRLHGR